MSVMRCRTANMAELQDVGSKRLMLKVTFLKRRVIQDLGQKHYTETVYLTKAREDK